MDYRQCVENFQKYAIVVLSTHYIITNICVVLASITWCDIRFYNILLLNESKKSRTVNCITYSMTEYYVGTSWVETFNVPYLSVWSHSWTHHLSQVPPTCHTTLVQAQISSLPLWVPDHCFQSVPDCHFATCPPKDTEACPATLKLTYFSLLHKLGHQQLLFCLYVLSLPQLIHKFSPWEHSLHIHP